MTRISTTATAGKHLKPKPGSVWIRTRLEGEESYSVSVLGREQYPLADPAEDSVTCGYAKLIMLDSGAIMAYFPLTATISAQAKLLMGATWFQLATPLVLPDFVFGIDMTIPAGRHPLVFVLESWVVLFRPIMPTGHNHPG